MERKTGELTTLWRDDESDESADADETGNDFASTVAEEIAPAVPRRRSPAAERRQFMQRQRRAREAALQVLFEVDLVGHDVVDVRERQFDQMLLTDEAREFAGRLVAAVLARRESLDTQIAALAPTWPVAQLPRVDLNVLRLALYELLEETQTPAAAIINEAVDLAKQYGSENSGRFVNGVLGTVATRIAAGEVQREAAG